MKVVYRIVKLAADQQCFGAGHYCIEHTITEVFAATPTELKARNVVEALVSDFRSRGIDAEFAQ